MKRANEIVLSVLLSACGSHSVVGTWSATDVALEQSQGVDRQISIVLDAKNNYVLNSTMVPIAGEPVLQETDTGTYSVESDKDIKITLTAISAQPPSGAPMTISTQADPNNDNLLSFCYDLGDGTLSCQPQKQTVTFTATPTALTLHGLYTYQVDEVLKKAQ